MSNKRKLELTMEKRATRSSGLLSTSASATPMPSVAVAVSRREVSASGSDNMDEDDEEAFVYDSDCEEPEAEPSEDEKEEEEAEVEEVGMLELSSGNESETPRSGKHVDIIMIDDSEDNDSDAARPPPEEPKRKGKITSRKQFQLDVEALVSQYARNQGGIVRDFEAADGEETVQFSLVDPVSNAKTQLTIMIPELAGYPISHQTSCYAQSDVSAEVDAILSEVTSLPLGSNRSLAGVIDYLISRIIHEAPCPWATNPVQDDEDEESYGFDDQFGLGTNTYEKSPAFLSTLRKDFKAILAAGFRPGFTRLSELDNVISVSRKVNNLGVTLQALQAWDSSLITGEVCYLVLLMNFGAKYPADPDNGARGDVQFRVGISPKYKPSRAAVMSAFRAHSVNKYTPKEFEAISLTVPLDSLFSDKFQEILLARRRNPNMGWAAAEKHCLQHGNSKLAPDVKAGRRADKEEAALSGSYSIPVDPMSSSTSSDYNNYPLLAYTYLVRRFVTCSRYCLICFKTIGTAIVALKPFVCESPLCLFQLISLGLGPSLEHEIRKNTAAVDLLVQLAFISAKEGGLPILVRPQGLSLEVPQNPSAIWKAGDPTVDLDSLNEADGNAGLAALINMLPPIAEMKDWLDAAGLIGPERELARTRKLQGMRGGSISNSAWKLLRWIIASNTSYLKSIDHEDEKVLGIPKSYRQFRLVVGSASKEHLLAESIKSAQARFANSVQYPTIYAFHGSATKNWHTILREGLHFKKTTNGRAYGHGVYFAKEGEISLGHYAAPAYTTWKGAGFPVGKLAAICEINNVPSEFVSSEPYYVVNQVDHIQCRYLIVQRNSDGNTASSTAADEATSVLASHLTKAIIQDPKRLITLSQKTIGFPDILPKLQAMDKKLQDTKEALADSDIEVIEGQETTAIIAGSLKGSRSPSKVKKATAKTDSFVPASADIVKLIKLLPPPRNPTKGASLSIQKEMRIMLKEQEQEGPTKCGYYFDPERSNDNIFTWVVELLGFDETLPIAVDMKAKGVTSLLMEIRFGDTFPLAPPFCRIVYPRFLPFINGGGGHVTGGGSICMDLLTSDGWSPVYQISAVLLQIRMAISNLEPRPARLDQNWQRPYTISEAVAGFERAAATHGWTVPDGVRNLL